jgi:hypothetical protein
MLRWLRRWPPAVWLGVYVGSLFIINGGQGDPPQLAVGIALALAAFGAGIYLAVGRWPGHPVPRGFYWVFGGVAAIYLIAGAVAALYNPLWGTAAVVAGVVPLTAVALLFATMRSKTVEKDGRVQDVAAADENDPYPAIGMNDTPQPEEEPPEDQVDRDAPEPRFTRGTASEQPDSPRPDRHAARRP